MNKKIPVQKVGGFTLIELVVSAAIISAIAVVTVNGLWDIVSTRSKQRNVVKVNQPVRVYMNELTGEISVSKELYVKSTNEIRIKNGDCRVVRYNTIDKKIEEFVDTDASCDLSCVDDPSCLASKGGFTAVTPDGISVNTLNFTPVMDYPENVQIVLTAESSDGLGKHEINYHTSVTPRI